LRLLSTSCGPLRAFVTFAARPAVRGQLRVTIAVLRNHLRPFPAIRRSKTALCSSRPSAAPRSFLRTISCDGTLRGAYLCDWNPEKGTSLYTIYYLIMIFSHGPFLALKHQAAAELPTCTCTAVWTQPFASCAAPFAAPRGSLRPLLRPGFSALRGPTPISHNLSFHTALGGTSSSRPSVCAAVLFLGRSHTALHGPASLPFAILEG